MPRSLQLLAATVLMASTTQVQVNSFSVPDSFHLMQTASSVTQQLSHVNLLDAYRHTLAENPLPTKMMTGASLAVCGDAIAQSQNTDEYDKRRAASFAVFDMAYRALQHFSFPLIVANCHGQFLGSAPFLANHLDASWLAAMESTLASQLGIVPFLYYPAFFALTGAVQGLSVEGAVTRAQENFLPLMKRNLLFWIPVQFVQFGFIQEDLQIPFLSVAGLGWTFILSVYAGSTKTYVTSPEDKVAAEMEEMLATSLEEIDDIPVSLGRAANATVR